MREIQNLRLNFYGFRCTNKLLIIMGWDETWIFIYQLWLIAIILTNKKLGR
jgi:hypothetical protein